MTLGLIAYTQHRLQGSLTVSARFRRAPGAAITCYAAGSYTFAESDPYSGLDLFFLIAADRAAAWPAIGRFFTTLSTAGLTGLLAALTAVLLAGGYATMRRVTV